MRVNEERFNGMDENNPVVSKRKRDFCLYHLKTGSLSCELMKSLDSHRVNT